MCRERTNFPELGLAVNQIKRNTDNILTDIQEWKHYCTHQHQGQVVESLNLAEERFNAALKLLEKALSLVNQPVVKDVEEVTISVIRK